MSENVKKHHGAPRMLSVALLKPINLNNLINSPIQIEWAMIDFELQKNLSNWQDHGTDFKQSTSGGGRYSKLKYYLNNILWAIVWDPNKVIDLGDWSISGGG